MFVIEKTPCVSTGGASVSRKSAPATAAAVRKRPVLFMCDVVKLTGLGYDELRAAIRAGTFPSSYRLNAGSGWPAWSAAEVERWMVQRVD